MCPEGRRLFGNLTVMENLQLACFARNDKEAIEEGHRLVFSTSSLAWKSAKCKSPPARFPVANSRCWPWAGPL